MQSLNRRTFLHTALLTLAGGAAIGALGPTRLAHAGRNTRLDSRRGRRLVMHNTHTGEQFNGIYRHAGHYDHHALSEINHFLRDHRTGDVREIDPEVLDILYVIGSRAEAGPGKPIHIISGYRSPETNARLRQTSTGVAKKSKHVEGRAIDFRLPGTNTSDLRRIALGLQAGGVGYYPRSNFVHIDNGRVRTW